MPLTGPFPGHTELTTFADLRRDLEGLIVRDSAGQVRAGIFPAHLNPLVTGRSDMKVNIADFRGVQSRGGAVLLANVGTDTSVQLPAAPPANKRIDLVYVTMRSTTLGDAASTPVFGFVQGTASPTPTVPSLPPNLVDALPLATVEIPAGATTTLSAGVIISQIYRYTALAGGTVVVRNTVELAAWTPADGAKAYCVSDTGEYVRSGGAWKPAGGGLLAAGTITAQTQLYINGLTGYDRYEVTLILPTASAANDINMRVTSGGVQDSSGNYDKQILQGASTTAAATKQVGQTVWGAMVGAARTVKTVRATLLNLNRAELTFAEVRASGWDAAGNLVVTETALWHNVASAFNGVWFNVGGSGTVTGRYEVRAL